MSPPIQQRIETAVTSLFPDGVPISRTVLAESSLPAGLLHFLLQTLDRKVVLESDRLFARNEGWLDENHPVVQQAKASLPDQLREAGQFPQGDWQKTVSQAIEAQLAYLQEPARALADFSFAGGASTLAAPDLRRRTGYFSDYPYMGKAVDAWLAQRSGQEIERNGFESAMRHLDCRLTQDYSVEQWLNLLKPLVETMQFAGVQPAGLPVTMVTRFFEAKDRPAIASLITSAAALHRAEMITLPSLREIIQKAFENERIRQEEQEPARERFEAASPEADSTPSVADSPSGKEAPLPLWKRFQQRVDGPGTAKEESAATKSAQPLWKSFEKQDDQGAVSRPDTAVSRPNTISRPDTADPMDDTSASVSGQDPERIPIRDAPRLEAQHIVLGTAVRSRDRFIRDLFQGNEDLFTDVMEQLSEAPDWSTASSIIADQIFRPFRIDIYSDVAVDFTNAVEARYSGLSA